MFWVTVTQSYENESGDDTIRNPLKWYNFRYKKGILGCKMRLLWENHEMHNPTLAIFPVHILPNNRWAFSSNVSATLCPGLKTLCVFFGDKMSLITQCNVTLGLGFLTWSTIYGLENFDVWDGSELSCVAVANIAAGNLPPPCWHLAMSEMSGDHIMISARACSKLSAPNGRHEMRNLWDLNPDVMWCAGVIDCVVTVNVIISPPGLGWCQLGAPATV